MNTGITVNSAQKVYVIPCGTGFTCFGFENAASHHLKMLTDLVHRNTALRGSNVDDSSTTDAVSKHPLAWNSTEDFGQLCGYEKYKSVLGLWCKSPAAAHTYFDPGTLPKVSAILEACRKTDRQLRLFLGDPETGRDWMEEHDTVGRIGRSMGPMKVPLLITDGEMGGGAILTSCVLRIIDASTLKELYRHPKFQEPNLSVHPEDFSPGAYKFRVDRDGQTQARFKKLGSAHSYVAFMLGHAVKVNTRH